MADQEIGSLRLNRSQRTNILGGCRFVLFLGEINYRPFNQFRLQAVYGLIVAKVAEKHK